MVISHTKPSKAGEEKEAFERTFDLWFNLKNLWNKTNATARNEIFNCTVFPEKYR